MFNLNPNNLTEQDKEAIRRYVAEKFAGEKKTRRIIFFILALIIPLFLAGLGFFLANIEGSIFLAWVMPTIGLLLALLMHGLSAGLEGKAGDAELRKQLVQRAQMELFVKRLTGQSLTDELFPEEDAEKPKRQLALSEDGEIVSAEEILESERRAKGKGGAA